MIEEFTRAWDELTAPGAQFAMKEIEVRGVGTPGPMPMKMVDPLSCPVAVTPTTWASR